MHIVLAVVSLAAHQVKVTPDTMTARGAATAVVDVDKTGMYHVQVDGPGGTACAVVDHLVGPFARGGVVGSKNCSFDAMLERGRVLVRLTSPENGTGRAALRATA